MKRFISILLLLATMISMVSGLYGCSSEDDLCLTVGQWLGMVNDAFGMDSYASDTPYFANVSKNNTYFEDVQIATEWDVINKDESLDVDAELTWGFAMVSLVNVGNFVNNEESDEAKIEYAINHFDNTIRDYWSDRVIETENAVVLLSTAQKQWANRTFEQRNEKVDYKEGVKDFTDNTNVAQSYVIEENTTVLPDSTDIELKVGDIYVLPGNDNSIGTKIFKVKDITREDGKVYIENDEDIELYDIAENITLQETVVPTNQNTVIYDANGNILSETQGLMSSEGSASAKPMVATNGSKGEYAQLASTNFKIEGWDINLSYSLDKTLTLQATAKKDEYEINVGLNNLKVTNEIDYEWFELKSASVRVDYDTNLSFKAGFSKKVADKVVAPYNNGNGKGLTNLKKAVFKDSKAAGGKGAQTIKLGSIDVWSVGVARVCLDVNFVVKVDGTFEFTITSSDSKGIEYKNKKLRFISESDKNIKISAEAKIEATLGIGPALYTAGLKKSIIGVHGVFGAGATASIVLNLVDSENHLIEAATAEDYPPEVYQAMLEAEITTDGASIKRAAEAQGGTYSVEASSEIKLHADVCINVTLYWIIRLEVPKNCYAAEILGDKVKLSKEFLGEKNGRFAYVHVENFDFISGFSNMVFGSAAVAADQCTKSYTPFEGAEDAEDSSVQSGDENTQSNDAILQGEKLILAEMSANIEIGQKYYVIIEQIPEGYTLNDIKITVENPDIAEVDKNGSIVAKEAGSTIIRVHTSDNKFAAFCALMVLDNTAVSLSPLSLVA